MNRQELMGIVMPLTTAAEAAAALGAKLRLTDPVVLTSQGESSGDVPGLIARVTPTLPGLEDALARGGAVHPRRRLRHRRVFDRLLAGVPVRDGRGARALGAVDGTRTRQRPPQVWTTGSCYDPNVWRMSGTRLPSTWHGCPPRSCRGRCWKPPLLASLPACGPVAWLVLGRYAAPADPLAEAIADLRTVRGGGTPLTDEEAIACSSTRVSRAFARCRATGDSRSGSWPAGVTVRGLTGVVDRGRGRRGRVGDPGCRPVRLGPRLNPAGRPPSSFGPATNPTSR